MQAEIILPQTKRIGLPSDTLERKIATMPARLFFEHLQLLGLRANLRLLMNDRYLHRWQRYADCSSIDPSSWNQRAQAKISRSAHGLHH